MQSVSADWTEWEGKESGAAPPLPRNLKMAAHVFASLDSVRGTYPGGMGAAPLPVSLDDNGIETRGQALGYRGARLALLIDQVTLFEHYWRRFEMQRIAEVMNR